MNFRTIAQMNECIVSSLGQVPRDIDLIVGVPRSGILPATILALYLNVALTDVRRVAGGTNLEPGPVAAAGPESWQRRRGQEDSGP